MTTRKKPAGTAPAFAVRPELCAKVVSLITDQRTPKKQRDTLHTLIYNLTHETNTSLLHFDWIASLLHYCTEDYVQRCGKRERAHADTIFAEIERATKDPGYEPFFSAIEFSLLLATSRTGAAAKGIMDILGDGCRLIDGRDPNTREAQDELVAKLYGLLNTHDAKDDDTHKDAAPVVSIAERRWQKANNRSVKRGGKPAHEKK